MFTFVHANVQNTVEAANVDILATDITPVCTPSTLRVMVALTASQVFNAIIIRGGNTQTVGFNSNVALVAEALYTFEIVVHSGDTINFQVEGIATVMVMRVQEVMGE